MTTKIISGSYPAGYSLSAAYSGLDITGSAIIGGAGVSTSAAATINNAGEILASASVVAESSGSSGVSLTQGGGVINSATIAGGQGGYVGFGHYGVGVGGAGVLLSAAGGVMNLSQGMIVGGAGGDPGTTGGFGGAGGVGVMAQAFLSLENYGALRGGEGGASAYGGDAVVAGGGGSLVNAGTLTGGQGGAGYPGFLGPGAYDGGDGGTGVVLAAGGTLVNNGRITGGNGGQGGSNFYFDGTYDYGSGGLGGAGVVISGGGTLIDSGVLAGGLGGEGFQGRYRDGLNGTNGAGVVFMAPGRLILAPGAGIYGGVQGGGGTLELDGGSGQITHLGAAAGVRSDTVNAQFSGFDAYVIDAGGAWSLGSGSLLATTQGLTVAGTLTNIATFTQDGRVTVAGAGVIHNAAGDSWLLNNGVILAAGGSGSFVNTGTLVRGDVASVNNIEADFVNTGTLAIDSGALRFEGAIDSFGGTVSGAGTLALFAGAATFAPALALSVAGVSVQGAGTRGLVDESLAFAGLWTQVKSTIIVGAGDVLSFTGAGDAFSGTIGGAGTVDFAGGSDALANLTLSTAHMQIRGATVTLAGVIDLGGVLTATTPELFVAAGGATLDGAGTLVLDNPGVRLLGVTAGAKFTNDATIHGAGQLGGGSTILANGSRGAIVGTFADALVIDTGAATVLNAGLIETAGTGGVTIAGAIDNAGTLAAAKGVLSVNGAVTGNGRVWIDGGLAAFGSNFSEAVAFGALGGELRLARSGGYGGVITGFSQNGKTSLDLMDIGFGASTRVSFNGGILTVGDGAHTDRIRLAGNFRADGFSVASDAHGGTLVTAFTAAAASFAPKSPGASGMDSSAAALAGPWLAPPSDQAFSAR